MLAEGGEAVATLTAPVDQPEGPEQEAVLENEQFKLTFTSRGGGVKLIELKQHPQAVTCEEGHDDGMIALNAHAQIPLLALRTDRNSYVWQPTADGGLAATAEWPGGLRVTKTFQSADQLSGGGGGEAFKTPPPSH
ncbi:MAG: hypothetical protein HC834_06870 [Rhodospirillales bacterium]|nr:hypothetical protein [Rhodospirillales bacterium]